jgi:PHP family Zn ribbon phosphoesterase
MHHHADLLHTSGAKAPWLHRFDDPFAEISIASIIFDTLNKGITLVFNHSE